MNALSLRTFVLAGSFVFAALGLAACSAGAESPAGESTSEALVATVGVGADAATDAGADANPTSDCSAERAAVNAAVKTVNAATDVLNACFKSHPRSECSAEIAAYNAAVDAYNAAVEAYNACIKKKKTPVEASAMAPLDAP